MSEAAESLPALGVFGGTFDPIHYGHLRTAFELLQALKLGEVRFLPAAMPPHRATPVASVADRLSMVRAACAAQPGFVVDTREVERDGPSWSVDTLESLRAEFPDRPLALIVGMDAFLGLPRWHRWQRILELAHVVVAHRPGWRAPESGPLGRILRQRRLERPDELSSKLAGQIVVYAVTQLEISSTEIRDLIRAGRDPRFLLPDCVAEHIAATGCYGSIR